MIGAQMTIESADGHYGCYRYAPKMFVVDRSRKICSAAETTPLGNPGSQWPQSVTVKDRETLLLLSDAVPHSRACSLGKSRMTAWLRGSWKLIVRSVKVLRFFDTDRVLCEIVEGRMLISTGACILDPCARIGRPMTMMCSGEEQPKPHRLKIC
jgi:hypothetical protein